ncbi:BTAD domain-containing putative transcriptional regulator [Streptomyces sp. SLBN-118]|uniref:AfsR/SARP family transcriptional regulator n=1 Tax=Streptomyces sp. SLBN-118 TaxID=2768454 RepID=UPI00135A9E01|nr:BTAD domain-containing putative transcriptional regulator [Streptomyces sp. SLBN-118]
MKTTTSPPQCGTVKQCHTPQQVCYPSVGAALPCEDAARPGLAAQPASPRVIDRERSVSIRCFGGFWVAIGDMIVDWSRVRPRARTAMRLLTLCAGRPVHRETLLEALWPNMPPEAAMANLHAAVSSVRRCLEPGRQRGESRMVVRTGEAYLLALPTGAHLDLLAFQSALARWRQARAVHDAVAAKAALYEALAEYRGELLPEDGPAEWLQHDREMYRRQAANAAAALAKDELDAGKFAEAAAVAEECLVIDPFHDACWHVLHTAYQQAGAPAAAERARRRYAEVLTSLGIDPAQGTSSGGSASPDPGCTTPIPWTPISANRRQNALDPATMPIRP